MKDNPNPWWGNVTARQASMCGMEVTDFLKSPTRQKSESFGQALALLILLGGGTTGQNGKILKSQEPHYGPIGEGLRICRSRLNDCGADLPGDLEKACPPWGVILYDMPLPPPRKPTVAGTKLKSEPGPS
jgi:hypothetical protein